MQHEFFRGVGTALRATNTAQAIIEAGLDWEVFKADLQTVDMFSGERIQLPKQCGVFRQDNNQPLGVVTKSYGVIQNAEAAGILDEVISKAPKQSPIKIRHGGCLFGGDRIFLTAELGNPILIGKESFSRIIVLSWGHNGGISLKASFMLVRIRMNTIINVKMRGIKSEIKIRHSKLAASRLKIASQVIENAFTYFDKISEKFTLLSDSLMTNLEFNNILKEVLPVSDEGSDRSARMVEKQRNEIKDIYADTPSAGTKLGAFMAIAEWNADKRSSLRKDKKDFGKNEVELNGALFGNRNKEMRTAFLKLLEPTSELATA